MITKIKNLSTHINPKHFPAGSKRAKVHQALSLHIPTTHGLIAILLVSIAGGRMLFALVNSMPEPMYTAKGLAAFNEKKGIAGRSSEHILVKFKENAGQEKRDSILATKGMKEKGEVSAIKVKLLTVPQGKTPESLVDELKNSESDSIEFAEVDTLMVPSYTPNDPSLGSEWHILKIQAPGAWDTVAKGQGVTVAILDSGTDCTHPDLVANCVPGWNIISNSSDATDINNHGTWVAGTAAAVGNNAIGVAGVAYQAKIMPIRITNDPAGYAYWSDVARAVTYAADKGARVVSNSYASTESASVQSAASYLESKGGLMVASAGNQSSLLSTANSPYIITVSATDGNDLKTSWSNYGPVIDIAAPGVSILSTARGGNYQYVQGTSFSAPIVAGTLALILSANPSLTPDQAKNILFSTANDLDGAGWDNKYGWGRVNAASAVSAALVTQGTQDTLAPSVPQNLTASSISSSEVALSWLPSTDNVKVTGYEVFRDEVKLATVTSTTYADKTVSATKNYTYKVRALDAAGNASIVSTGLPVATPEITLAVTSNSVVNKTGTTATIKWSTTLPVTSVVSYGTSNTSLTSSQSVNASSTNSQITLSGLTKKTNYYYQITVTDASGKTQKTAVANFTTRPK